MLDIKAILDKYGISYATRGKWARPGWVQVHCPFCTGHEGWHGGINVQHLYYHCWRCRWHPLDQALSHILDVSWREARDLLKAHTTGHTEVRHPGMSPAPTKVRLPIGGPWSRVYDYLEGRGFNPYHTINQWDLKPGHPGSPYKLRIIAPIYMDGRLVSYQGRDMLGREPKYKACPTAEEIYHHKYTMYGIDEATEKKPLLGGAVVVVEGITDVWRLGAGAVATFGTGFTQQQVRLLANRFDKHFVWFDNEPEAQRQADKLAQQLCGLGKEAMVVLSDKPDPAEVGGEEVAGVWRQLIGWS